MKKVSEKSTKNAGRFKHLFGLDKANETDVPDEKMDETEQTDSVVSAIFSHSESEENGEDKVKDADSGIEREAREYYNNHHSQSVEDKVRSIHENALNSYANESPQTAANDVSEESEDNEGENLPEEETQAAENEEISETAATADTEKTENQNAAAFGETKNYDMSQLISVLKESGNGRGSFKKTQSDEEYDDDDGDVSEDSLDIHDSELYDDVNEYRHDFEYTDRVQGAALFAGFRKSAVIATASVILTLLATIVCVWFELGHAAGLPFSGMMQPGRYGRVYAMISLQVLAFAVFFNLDGLSRGIHKLSVKRPAPEAIAVVTTALCALQTIYTAFTAYESLSYKTYCFAGCFVLLVLSVNTFIKAYTRFKAFAMVLSKKPKLSTKNLDHLAEEYAAFEKYLSEDSEVLAVTKTDSVSDFVKHTYTVPEASRSCNRFMYFVLGVSVVAALLGVFLLKKSPYEALTGASLIYLFSAPVGMLISTALPYFVSSVKASALHSAILGEAAGDTFDNAAVLSFDDTEVFPPKAVKITNIKTYNDHRIDKIVVYMTAIFNKIGGPLS